MNTRVFSGVLGVALVTLAGHAAAGSSITQIGTLGGFQSNALGINDARQVVGQASLPGDAFAHAYLWQNGAITDLGALDSKVSSTAWRINNLGQVVGWSGQPAGGNAAMMWHNGVATNINDAMGATNSVGWDINDSGVIVGQGNLGPGLPKGFVYTPGEGGQSAGTLPGYQGGANLGINGAGQIVGHSYFFGDASKAHLATRNPRGGYDSVQIGPDLQAFSMANDINNLGVAVGQANNPSGPWNACIFTLDSKNPIISLGSLPDYATSEANSINDAGMIVGFAFDGPAGADPRAFVYFDGAMHDLNDYLPKDSNFAWLINATGVNSHGDIVGIGRTTDGYLAGFLLTGVPAPGTLTLLGAGALLAARRRR